MCEQTFILHLIAVRSILLSFTTHDTDVLIPDQFGLISKDFLGKVAE